MFFLEQCLRSVEKACIGLDTEVFVVDNNSIDDSCSMVKQKFPKVKLIESKENLGFSKGNNLAIKEAKGEYVLLLNPDTVVEESTFSKTVAFMDSNPKAGALGVKMIDGKGEFLPESKRGLPTPSVAFYKIFGLSALFPKSKTFGKYHLSYLDKNENHEIAVLSGAFMLMRSKALEKSGLLDEAFFMYGEDIDLSYRITQEGYKNYYFSDTQIIHYKGESTKKSSINYVFVFYNAMIIFAKKHFSSSNASLFSTLINIAIYFRAGIAILRRILSNLVLPFFDGLLISSGLFLLKENYQELTGINYEPFTNLALIGYTTIWISTLFVSGGYDIPIRLKNVIKGSVLGTALILIMYALLDESYRFSRAIILLGSAWTLISSLLLRIGFNLFNIKPYIFEGKTTKRIAIIGSPEEIKNTEELLNQINYQPDIIVKVMPKHITNNTTQNFYLQNEKLQEAADFFNLTEIIFCNKDNDNESIISTMGSLTELKLDYKISNESNKFLIGSNAIETIDSTYQLSKVNAISLFKNKRIKRTFDIIVSIIILTLLPVLIFSTKRKLKLIYAIPLCMLGLNTWVGYNKVETNTLFPKIKSGIFEIHQCHKNQNKSHNELVEQNIGYVKAYSLPLELNLFINGLKQL